MNVPPVAHRQRQRAHGPSEQGASLIIVLAIMLIGGLTIAGLITYTQTSLRGAQSYRSRTNRVQDASDAIDLALVQIRWDRTQGLEGSTITRNYETATATCTGDPGSGKTTLGVITGGTKAPDVTADRTVTCLSKSKASGPQLVQTRVQMLDHNGDDPGYAVQVLDRNVAG